jgi:mannose-6-phosphate isomerase-like protein (cupin superfamily)
MIARRWRGWAGDAAGAAAYTDHFTDAVRPVLEGTDGFVDASLERVAADDGRIEIVVVTRWASMDAIRAFAGDDVDAAVVEPDARAVLDGFDERVRHVVRLGIIEGDFHWHKHDDQDELFLVLEGELLVDLQEDGRTVSLGPHQAFAVPRGVVHRTRAPGRTTILMVEAAGVVPTGD